MLIGTTAIIGYADAPQKIDESQMIGLLLACSFGLAGIGIGFDYLPDNVVQTIYQIFIGGIALYQVFYKAIYQQTIMNKKDV